jgi:PAS domain S-box-containing protein
MATRTAPYLAVAIALSALAGLSASAPAVDHMRRPRTVLALFFSSEDYPSNPVRDEGIREGLRSGTPWPIDYYTEYLESDRFPAEQATLALRDYLRDKYQGRRIDAVIAVTDTALNFTLRFQRELFADVPIVYFGNVAADEQTRRAGAGVTGVIVGSAFPESLSLALKLHPATERIFVVVQTPNLALQDSVRSSLESAADRARLTFITEAAVPRMLAQVEEVPGNSLIFYLRHSQEEPGRVLFASDVARLVAAASTVPVYGVSDSYLGSGIVGGAVYQTRAIGVRLGQQAIQILDGTRAQDLPIERAEPVAIFDWRQLQRWNISESLLPSGSTILFKQVGVWDQYRPLIIGAIGLVGVQTALIGTLLFQRARRRRVETALVDSQQRYTLASAAGAVGVWDWNFETDELFVDPGLKSLLGFDDREISTRPDDWGSRVHPDDLAVAAAGVKNCIDGITDSYEVEHRMLHKDGSVKWMLSRGSALRGADQSLRRLVGTKVDITERKLAEDVIRESQAVLAASHREINDLAGRLIASQEVERARIARDLHDDLSQEIAGLSIALSAIKRQVTGLADATNLARDVSSVQQRAVALAANVRDLSHDLHPSVLEHAGLVTALTAHCTEIERHQRLAVTFSAEGDFDSTSAEIKLCLYRVAQEGLRNVVTHANAGRAEVRLSRAGDIAELSIADDGRGFDIVGAGRDSHGIGLVSISERVRLVGGTVSILTELNKGTRLRVQVPANGYSVAALAH